MNIKNSVSLLTNELFPLDPVIVLQIQHYHHLQTTSLTHQPCPQRHSSHQTLHHFLCIGTGGTVENTGGTIENTGGTVENT